MTPRTWAHIPLLAGLLMVALPHPGSAQAIAHAWAHRPSVAEYSPDTMYSRNSNGGQIAVVRRGIGDYVVTFFSLGGAGGSVQVTAYGPGNSYCKVVGWDSLRAHFIVSVACFTARGAPTDSRFVVQLFGNSPGQQGTARTFDPVFKADTVIYTHPDGTIVKRYSGGFTRISPNGQQSTAIAIQTPPRTPPVLPGQPAVVDWLEDANNNLLDIIRTEAGEDFASDVAQSDAVRSIYGTLEGRLWVLSQLARLR